MQTLASLILHGLLRSIPFLCSTLRTRLHSHFAHDRARAAFGGMSSALIEKITCSTIRSGFSSNIQRHPPRIILGRCLPIPVRIVPIWWTCAGYFGAIVSPHAPPHPLAPRAAFGGATALRCSAVPAPCSHAQRVLPAGPPRKKHRQSGALSWWTCAGSNRGLTEFVCGHYTFSL